MLLDVLSLVPFVTLDEAFIRILLTLNLTRLIRVLLQYFWQNSSDKRCIKLMHHGVNFRRKNFKEIFNGKLDFFDLFCEI